MRNLKRVLSLALALVMVLGMMVITTSAATFTDAEEITYTEAVDVMSALGVINGIPAADGTVSFNPKAELTREQAATLICYLKVGKKTADLLPGTASFTDVAADRWSAGYIGYCVNLGYIAGHGDGTFTPDAPLTALAYGKLLLCALGYDAEIEGYVGKNWSTAIAAGMVANGLMVDGVELDDTLTREQAAQMTLQAIQAETVSYGLGAAFGLTGAVKTGVTFMEKYFGLAKVEGVIDAVNGKGETTFFVGLDKNDEPVYTTVSGTDVDFSDIGYAAYVWAQAGKKEDTSSNVALTDVFVTGTSLGESTNGTSDTLLTAPKLGAVSNPFFKAAIDKEGCSVFYNGEYVGEYADGYAKKTDKNYDKDVADVLAKIGKVGVKVDYVDNDNKGKAEAVVVTEYTFAEVTEVKKQSKSGEVSVKYYELDNDVKIAPSELVYVDELAKGDYITYVAYELEDKDDYNDYSYYYITVLEESEGELEYITRDKLNDEDTSIYVYTIDGEDYIKSDLSAAENTAFLKRANIDKDVVYVLDQYGYIVHAEEPKEDPDSYVFVLDNEDSHGIKNLAETELVFVDGTVDVVDTTWKFDIEDGDLADAIYTYTVKNGVYTLKATEFEVAEKLDYETKTRVMGKDKVDLTLKTVVVDLRDYLAGDADEGTVYVGYREIPSFEDGTIYYLKSAAGMTLAFLVDGEDPAAAANLEAAFVVFNTNYTRDDKVDGEWTYVLDEGVLIEGEVVYDYILTQAQKDAIDALGVGVYQYAKDGTLTYTSFEDQQVEWTPESSGALFKGDKEITDDYTAIFLNIADGEVNDWVEDVDDGFYYCWYDESDKDNKLIYIVADTDVTGDVLAKVSTVAKENVDVITVFGKKAYYVEEGKVTNTTDNSMTKALEHAEKYGITALVYADGKFVEVPAASTTKATSSAALATAIADTTVDTVVLGKGDYTVDMYNIADKKSLTIIGDGTTKIEFSKLQVRASQFDELIIENCIIERMPDKAWGHLVFGSSDTAGGVYTIRNCTFNGEGSQGIYINQDVAATFNIENCTFNGNFGSEGAITIQNNDGVKITVNVTDCTFNNIPATSHEIFVHYEYDGWTLNAKGVDAYWANK